MSYPFSALAEAIGESETQTFWLLRVNGARRAGILEHGIDIDQAERWALKLGLHPYEVWPQMAAEAAYAGTEPCKACGEPFVPTNRRHVYCSDTCKHRIASRRRRATDEGRELNRLRRRAYYAECGDYVRAQSRAHYWADPERVRQRKRAQRARLQLGEAS